MSGYSSEEQRPPYEHFSPPTQIVIEPSAAEILLAQALARPSGPEADLILNANLRGLRIDFARHGRQVLGFDDLVSRAQILTGAHQENPIKNAFGNMILASVFPNHLRTDNGK